MGNDIPIINLGWTRGNLDMVSTELSAGQNLCAGYRGITLPPFGRFSPLYKLGTEHSRSRFMNVWLYNDGYEDYLKHDPDNGYYANTNLCQVMYAEMLASHAMPMVQPSNHRVTGDPTTNGNFFEFVSQVDPLFKKRDLVADIGIYYSSSSILSQFLPGGMRDFGNQPHQFANWGWATALGQLHYQYRFIPEWKLDSNALEDLKVLIIPNSEVFDNSDVTNILLPWVQAGGKLIVTGNSGYRHGEGVGLSVNSSGYSLSPLTGVSDDSGPSTTQNNVGAGKVYYVKDNIGMDYFNVSTAAERTSRLSNFSTPINAVLSGVTPFVASTDANVDDKVGITLYEDTWNGKLFVDIVNYDIVLATDVQTNTPAITFDIAMPDWLAGKALNVDIVSQYAVNAVTIDTISLPGRIQITAPPIKFYASVIIGFDNDTNIDDSDSVVNLKDFAVFAAHWMESPCYAENDWCDGADIDISNNVDHTDLLLFVEKWLYSF